MNELFSVGVSLGGYGDQYGIHRSCHISGKDVVARQVYSFSALVSLDALLFSVVGDFLFKVGCRSVTSLSPCFPIPSQVLQNYGLNVAFL